MNTFFNTVKVVPNKPLAGLADFSRRVASEGIVVLKNENHLLPLEHRKVAVFGRIQTDYYKSGTGSGGLVNVSHVTSILEGLLQNPLVEVNEELLNTYRDWIKENPYNAGNGQWASEPWSQVEMPVNEALVQRARSSSDVALIILGRTAGEDKDNFDGPGSYRLSELEEDLIAKVTKQFEHTVVVLNVGAVVDMRFMDRFPVEAVVYGWHGGMEGGRAVADVLTGLSPASGKLSSTIVYDIQDYPSHANFGARDKNIYQEDIYVGYRYFSTFASDRVRYPFGFGLTYTTWSVQTTKADVKDLTLHIEVSVTNTGDREGKEVVQLYVNAPQGLLGKPTRQLIGFAKSKLLRPGETETLRLSIPFATFASYDDGGLTGHRSAWVLEEGPYEFYLGGDSLTTNLAFTSTLPALVVVEQLEEAAAPVTPFERLKPLASAQGFTKSYEATPLRQINRLDRIDRFKPKELAKPSQPIKLIDVYRGLHTLNEFVGQLSNDELAWISRGEGMSSPKVTPGTAAAYGGVTDELIAKGIPLACASDGPSGIRMDSGQIATSLPNGIAIACTFNADLVEELYYLDGLELRAYRIDTLLGPGMNIHRHPLNGRNFEYFSEDPLLTGMMGAAITRGLQHAGVTGTLKHMACNNQETARFDADSILSERALREIYLRGFEIAIKAGQSRTIMTSYNPINGIWAASHFDINTVIVRQQWGFDGLIMTDWWAKMNDDGEPGSREHTAYMIRSQNDLYMVVSNAKANSSNDDTEIALQHGRLSRAEAQRTAKNIIKFLLKTPAFFRHHHLTMPTPTLPSSFWFRVDKQPVDYPVVQAIQVNGKPLEGFDPFITNYWLDGDEQQPANVDVATAAHVTTSLVQARPGVNVTLVQARVPGATTNYLVGVVNLAQREAENKVLDLSRLRSQATPKLPNQAWANVDFRIDHPIEKSDTIQFEHFGTETVITNCTKGTSVTYGVELESEGKYIVELTLRSSESSLAQLPFSILVDGEIKATLTSNGTDGKWINVNAHMPISTGVHYISLLFNRTGLEFKQIKIVKHG